jgi:hypothetical protein
MELMETISGLVPTGVELITIWFFLNVAASISEIVFSFRSWDEYI